MYHGLFRLAASLQEKFVGNGPSFQYIVTTTTRPPEELCGEPWVRLKLDARDDAKLLFRKCLEEQGTAGTACEKRRGGRLRGPGSAGARHTRPRDEIMNLLLLAPDIQEELLLLPLTDGGRAPIRERMLRPIAAVIDWRKQRKMWKQVLAESSGA